MKNIFSIIFLTVFCFLTHNNAESLNQKNFERPEFEFLKEYWDEYECIQCPECKEMYFKYGGNDPFNPHDGIPLKLAFAIEKIYYEYMYDFEYRGKEIFQEMNDPYYKYLIYDKCDFRY